MSFHHLLWGSTVFLFFLVGCGKKTSTTEMMTTTPTTPTTPPTSTTPTTPTTGRIICEEGMAGIYPCGGYDLLATISLQDFGSNSGNDSWGWTDPATNKEYVLMGLDDGTAFVDISDPINPLFLGKLLTATSNSVWRDIKVYNNHAFIVSEASGHGLQVFDLTKLRGVTTTQNFTADAVYNTAFGNAHNIAINPDKATAYVVGARYSASNNFNGGPIMLDISNPLLPSVVGTYDASFYCHDAHIVTYNGPDARYRGREILFGSNGDEGSGNNQIIILDVTDPANPVLISSISYSADGYAHQGWLAEDHTYFYFGDELDEVQNGFKTRTRVFDVTDLTSPQLHYEYSSNSNSIDHNGYTKDNLLYLANYTSGVRMIDISNIADKSMTEVGYFDTFPNSNSTSFDGLWSVYPFFESGVIVLSDYNSGLFLVQKSAN